jgi:hypothetical protein
MQGRWIAYVNYPLPTSVSQIHLTASLLRHFLHLERMQRVYGHRPTPQHDLALHRVMPLELALETMQRRRPANLQTRHGHPGQAAHGRSISRVKLHPDPLQTGINPDPILHRVYPSLSNAVQSAHHRRVSSRNARRLGRELSMTIGVSRLSSKRSVSPCRPTQRRRSSGSAGMRAATIPMMRMILTMVRHYVACV